MAPKPPTEEKKPPQEQNKIQAIHKNLDPQTLEAIGQIEFYIGDQTMAECLAMFENTLIS